MNVQRLELRLSTTNTAPGSIGLRMNENVGDDETLVYSGPISFETSGSAGPNEGPLPFDYVINFQTPFIYDPNQGNLFADIRVFGASGQAPYVDSQSASLIHQVGAGNALASFAGARGAFRTVTQFVFDAMLQAGDANQDLSFDQFDLIQVQQAATYLTGKPATWGQGDWNGAPGGSPGSPPVGDGLFNQLDVVAAQLVGMYLSGPYAAIRSNGQRSDSQTSIVYNASTGELTVDAPTAVELTSINIDSATGMLTGDSARNLGGSFDNDEDGNIFKATFGGSFGSLTFGNVAQAGLSEEFVLGDLTVNGSLAGGGDLGDVDLVYVPEPSTALLFIIGGIVGLFRLRHKRCATEGTQGVVFYDSSPKK